MLKKVIAELEAYGLNVVSAAKANLKKNKKNSSGALYESVDYKITNAKGNNPQIDIIKHLAARTNLVVVKVKAVAYEVL